MCMGIALNCILVIFYGYFMWCWNYSQAHHQKEDKLMEIESYH